MKKYLFAFMLFGSTAAHAIPLVDFVDFGPGNGFQTINDSASVPTRSWTHNILDDIGGKPIDDILITDAVLFFHYSKTEGNEHWFLNQGLGELPVIGERDATRNFVLGENALLDLQADGMIGFTTSENTVGGDSFRRFDATLSGNYTLKQIPHAAPEPTSALLFWIGLTGLYFSRRNTFCNKEILGSSFHR